MANITRIKASDSNEKKARKDQSLTKDTPKKTHTSNVKESKGTKSQVTVSKNQSKDLSLETKPAQEAISHTQTKNASKPNKKLTKLEKAQAKYEKKQLKKQLKLAKKANKKPLPKALRILTAPFRKIGSYFHDSWLELRQVRWPNRKMTWKLVSAVIIYTVTFSVIIMLLDAGFTLLFNNLLK